MEKELPAATEEKQKKPKKVGIIRCQQTEDICPGTTDFKIAALGELAFKNSGRWKSVVAYPAAAARAKRPFCGRGSL